MTVVSGRTAVLQASGRYAMSPVGTSDLDKMLNNFASLGLYVTVGRSSGSDYLATGAYGLQVTFLAWNLSGLVFSQNYEPENQLAAFTSASTGGTVSVSSQSITVRGDGGCYVLKDGSGNPQGATVDASTPLATYTANLVNISGLSGTSSSTNFFLCAPGAYCSDQDGRAVIYDGGSGTWTILDVDLSTPLATLTNHSSTNATGTYTGSGNPTISWVAGTTSGAATGSAASYSNPTDHTTIQNAINQVAAAGGGTVMLKAGTYYCNATITNESSWVRVVGEGRATRIFAITDYGDILRWTPFPLSSSTGLGVISGSFNPPQSGFIMEGAVFSNFIITSLVNRTLPWNGQALPGGKQMTDPQTTGTYVRGGAAIFTCGCLSPLVENVICCESDIYTGTVVITNGTMFNGIYHQVADKWNVDSSQVTATNLCLYNSLCNQGIVHGHCHFTSNTSTNPGSVGTGIYLDTSNGVLISDVNAFGLSYGVQAWNTYALLLSGGYCGDSCSTAGVYIHGGLFAALLNPWGAGSTTGILIVGHTNPTIVGGSFRANVSADIEIGSGTSNVSIVGAAMTSTHGGGQSLLLDSGATSVSVTGGSIAVLTNGMSAGNLSMLNVAGQPNILKDFGSAPSSAGTAGTLNEMVCHSGILYLCTAAGIAGAATWTKVSTTSV